MLNFNRSLKIKDYVFCALPNYWFLVLNLILYVIPKSFITILLCFPLYFAAILVTVIYTNKRAKSLTLLLFSNANLLCSLCISNGIFYLDEIKKGYISPLAIVFNGAGLFWSVVAIFVCIVIVCIRMYKSHRIKLYKEHKLKNNKAGSTFTSNVPFKNNEDGFNKAGVNETVYKESSKRQL